MIKTKHNQSLADIAIQYSGDVEAQWLLAVDNNISPTAELAVNQELIEPHVINQSLVRFYKNNGIIPVTAIDQSGGVVIPTSLLFAPGLFSQNLFE